jgi:hypothetical protein
VIHALCVVNAYKAEEHNRRLWHQSERHHREMMSALAAQKGE